MQSIDFTQCPKILGRTYNGANGKKISIRYKGSAYMLKFPPSGSDKPTMLSYTNSCFSEHIGSSIFNLVGIKAQETLLGTYTVDGKEKIVCACKDFTENNLRFFDFCSLKNTILDSDTNGSGTELDDILDTIVKQEYISSVELKKFFWDMFIVDALLGNFDRHNGNWGFLFSDETQSAIIAPVFDCGSCLLPQADQKVMQEVLTDENALNARVFQFPTSSIKKNDKKINYYDFLTSCDYKGCTDALLRVFPKIELPKIFDFIDTIPYITELQKTFYKKYLEARYTLILKAAYEMLSTNK